MSYETKSQHNKHPTVLSLSMFCTGLNMSKIITLNLKKHSVYAARAAADKKVEWDCALLHRQRMRRPLRGRPSLEVQREGAPPNEQRALSDSARNLLKGGKLGGISTENTSVRT